MKKYDTSKRLYIAVKIEMPTNNFCVKEIGTSNSHFLTRQEMLQVGLLGLDLNKEHRACPYELRWYSMTQEQRVARAH